MKNIVIIGGGTGTFTVLSGLRKFPTNNSVIASTADDGGSGGALREQLGVIPPGDFRQCLAGLSYTDPVIRNMFSYRFDTGELKGHTIGNIMLAGLEKMTDITTAISTLAKMLNVRGAVIPITLKQTKLSAKLQSGKTIVGEHNIDEPHHAVSPIKSISLSPSMAANPRALAALKAADVIVFGPGDLYTSVLPNLLPKGVVEAINNSKARKVAVNNIMTKHGQTDGFTAADFVTVLNQYLKPGKNKTGIDTVIVNNKKPNAQALALYKKEKAFYVEPNAKALKDMGLEVISANLVAGGEIKKNKADALKRSFLRHDSNKIAKLIWQLASK